MDAVMMDVDGVTDAGPHWVKVKPEWVSEAMERRSCLDMLMSRFGFDAALVSVPQLAKAFGISKSSIYAQVRSGAFFIPHRMVGSSPTFTIDDVVTWYMQGQVKQGQRPINRVQNTKSENLKSAAMKLRMDRTVDEMVAEARVRVSPKFID
jgi:predicted DNA-binding transcriptional regulator AlpA